MSWRQGEFAARVVDWQRRCGRRDLPWQRTCDPYRVWLSEIMLQQTQVTTARDYYARFLQHFPDVHALADASLDAVLALWAGLGYYTRARNLHRCAREIVANHGGRFPSSAAELKLLPGIGRSTAGAIAAFCFDERVPILDGNVKRTLARVFAIDGDPSAAAVQRDLWRRAQALLPGVQASESMPAYTQGLMDLGATVCRVRKPRCQDCPLADRCLAFRKGDVERYPVRRSKPARQRMLVWLLLAVDRDRRVWLVRRPVGGIWAGLYCLPAFDTRADLLSCVPQHAWVQVEDHSAFTHVLTHRELVIHVVSWNTEPLAPIDTAGNWFAADRWPALGVPSPVRRLLRTLADERIASTLTEAPVHDDASAHASDR